MRLFEIQKKKLSPLASRLIAISGQLKNDVENGQIKDVWTVDKLLNYFQKYDIILDKEDLYTMIKKPPLDKVISNIKGDDVVFKDTEADTEEPANVDKKKEKDVVKKMAHKALK